MNNNGAPHDDLPQDASLRTLLRQLPAEEPPAQLDEAILAAARREVRARPVHAGWSARWRIPLAAAASVLLSVVLVRQIAIQEKPVAAWDDAAAPAAEAVIGDNAGDLPQETAQPAMEDRAAAQRMAPAAVAERRAEGTARAEIGALAESRKPDAPAKALATDSLEREAVASADVTPADVASAGVASGGAAAFNGAVAGSAPAPAASPASEADALRDEPAHASTARETAKKKESANVQLAYAPRSAPWPSGVTPDLAPDIACARLVQDAGGHCSGRRSGGVLELYVTPADPDWPARFAGHLVELGWLPAAAHTAGETRHERRGEDRIDVVTWQVARGTVTLRLSRETVLAR